MYIHNIYTHIPSCLQCACSVCSVLAVCLQCAWSHQDRRYSRNRCFGSDFLQQYPYFLTHFCSHKCHYKIIKIPALFSSTLSPKEFSFLAFLFPSDFVIQKVAKLCRQAIHPTECQFCLPFYSRNKF